MKSTPTTKPATTGKPLVQPYRETLFLRNTKGDDTSAIREGGVEKFAASSKLSFQELSAPCLQLSLSAMLPESITALAADRKFGSFVQPAQSLQLALVKNTPILPNEHMAVTKVPDASAGIVAKYALNDEQALLAKVRYNRLVDIFSGVTCIHSRSPPDNRPEMGQVETDEIYIVWTKSAHYVFPIQARAHGQTEHRTKSNRILLSVQQVSAARLPADRRAFMTRE